jgi:hypothetical protein
MLPWINQVRNFRNMYFGTLSLSQGDYLFDRHREEKLSLHELFYAGQRVLDVEGPKIAYSFSANGIMRVDITHIATF